MINQEIKGNLAKLLATENLVVEHRKVSTASFDTQRRVLTLPIWNKASATVYDMLVGHEVGHALFTPDVDWRESVRNNIPKDYVNVVEDARIEKLMKRKYPGLSRSFYGGYQELNDEDFFCVKEENLAELSFIDRINLHFKVGAFAMIPFADDTEQQFVARVADAETFEDVLAICEDLVDYLKDKEQQQETVSLENAQQDAGGAQQGSSNSDAQQEQTPDGESSEGQSEESEEGDSEESGDSSTPPTGGGSGAAGGPNEEESKTQRSFDQNSENLSHTDPWHYDTQYVEIPKVDLNNIVVDHEVIHDHINKFWTNLEAERQHLYTDMFDYVDIDYNNYKKSAQKEVNYLVKEFECKKSADAYARAGVSRTGVLDTTKLHTYKYNDDIFRKVTILPDGKNHGLVFVLDWSGSMGNVLLDTVKQLLNLCWFCKKVQIPFEVYAFTYEWNPLMFDEEMESIPEKFPRKFGQIDIHRMFHMLNFLSSRTNSRQFDQQAKNIFRLAYQQSCYTRYHCPPGLDLSGTPLNESIIALHGIIPQFKNSNKLQKVNVVILTDGEGGGLTYTTENDYAPHGIGSNRVSSHCALRDRKTGNVYRKFDETYNGSLTAILLENLKDNFPEVNLIGFRIIGGSEFNRFYRYLYGQDRYYSTDVPESVAKVWRKEKSVEMKPMGYNALYVLASSGLSADTSFEVSDNASTAEIRKAFKQVLKKKSTNKKLLSSFASLVS